MELSLHKVEEGNVDPSPSHPPSPSLSLNMSNVHVKKRVDNALTISNLLILLTYMEKMRILNGKQCGNAHGCFLMRNTGTNLRAIIAYFKKKKLSY